uniref:Uncharacterized protein n=1 Tax=Anguilla anguilla TaxID=7936 RepID=A0A0E9UNK4_ANGAN
MSKHKACRKVITYLEYVVVATVVM